MHFSHTYLEELAAARIQHGQQQDTETQETLRKQQQYEHTALRERGLRLGAKVTRFYRTVARDDGYKISKIAELPMLSSSDFGIQSQIRFKPPLRPEGKNLGFDETRVLFRLFDPTNGAHTNFHELATFEQTGWIRYADPDQAEQYCREVRPGDPKLRAVSQLLTVLESASFCITD